MLPTLKKIKLFKISKQRYRYSNDINMNFIVENTDHHFYASDTHPLRSNLGSMAISQIMYGGGHKLGKWWFVGFHELFHSTNQFMVHALQEFGKEQNGPS